MAIRYAYIIRTKQAGTYATSGHTSLMNVYSGVRVVLRRLVDAELIDAFEAEQLRSKAVVDLDGFIEGARGKPHVSVATQIAKRDEHLRTQPKQARIKAPKQVKPPRVPKPPKAPKPPRVRLTPEEKKQRARDNALKHYYANRELCCQRERDRAARVRDEAKVVKPPPVLMTEDEKRLSRNAAMRKYMKKRRQREKAGVEVIE